MSLEDDAAMAAEGGVHEAIVRRWRDIDYAADYCDDGEPILVVDRNTGKKYEITVEVRVLELTTQIVERRQVLLDELRTEVAQVQARLRKS